MKVKRYCDAATDDFWYDLTIGGYLKPDEIVEDVVDLQQVLLAMEIPNGFYNACEE